MQHHPCVRALAHGRPRLPRVHERVDRLLHARVVVHGELDQRVAAEHPAPARRGGGDGGGALARLQDGRLSKDLAHASPRHLAARPSLRHGDRPFGENEERVRRLPLPHDGLARAVRALLHRAEQRPLPLRPQVLRQQPDEGDGAEQPPLHPAREQLVVPAQDGVPVLAAEAEARAGPLRRHARVAGRAGEKGHLSKVVPGPKVLDDLAPDGDGGDAGGEDEEASVVVSLGEDALPVGVLVQLDRVADLGELIFRQRQLGEDAHAAQVAQPLLVVVEAGLHLQQAEGEPVQPPQLDGAAPDGRVLGAQVVDERLLSEALSGAERHLPPRPPRRRARVGRLERHAAGVHHVQVLGGLAGAHGHLARAQVARLHRVDHAAHLLPAQPLEERDRAERLLQKLPDVGALRRLRHLKVRALLQVLLAENRVAGVALLHRWRGGRLECARPQLRLPEGRDHRVGRGVVPAALLAASAARGHSRRGRAEEVDVGGVDGVLSGCAEHRATRRALRVPAVGRAD